MVFDVTLHHTTGASVTRPVVADSADEAMAVMAADHGVSEYDKSVTIVAKERADPEGRLAKLLNDAEKRREEDEFYRPARGARRGR